MSSLIQLKQTFMKWRASTSRCSPDMTRVTSVVQRSAVAVIVQFNSRFYMCIYVKHLTSNVVFVFVILLYFFCTCFCLTHSASPNVMSAAVSCMWWTTQKIFKSISAQSCTAKRMYTRLQTPSFPTFHSFFLTMPKTERYINASFIRRQTKDRNCTFECLLEIF